jgi:cytosine/uracil/thiamine/allantoin permease
MKRYTPLFAIVLLASTLSGCDLVAGIFKAGVWTGIIVIVIIVALLIWILSKLFGGRNN